MNYFWIIFSLAGFKGIIGGNISDSLELIIDLLGNPEIKSISNSVKNVLKNLELLINILKYNKYILYLKNINIKQKNQN